jgi:NADH-ubiquinone oxidoreductase chain 6
MFLSSFIGLFLCFVFLLPVMQQGVRLVIVIFSLAVLLRCVVGTLGHVWYGFSLFLIYVGGLLVMFGYVVAMVPNFLFKQSFFLPFFLSGGLIGLLFVIKFSLREGVFDTGGFLYSNDGYLVLIGLAFVLFFTLVCVVKVCYFNKGSLRPFRF